MDSNPLTNADGDITQFDITGYEDWQPFFLRLRLDSQGVAATFKIRPDFSDERTPIDSSLASADIDRARRILNYTFSVRKQALELSRETLLSDREAEVVIMLTQGDSVEEISDISDIPSISNIRTYIDRISKREDEARANRKEAERTLAALEQIEVSE